MFYKFRFGYHFTYVNVKKDSINKYKMTIYYFWTLIENVAFAVVWFFRRDSGLGLNEMLPSGLSLDETVAEIGGGSGDEMPQMTALQLVCLIPAVNILGILVMIVYYMCFHPRIGCCNHQHHEPDVAEQVELSPLQGAHRDDYEEKQLAVEVAECEMHAKKSVNYQTWPRSSNSSCSSRSCSVEELMRDSRKRLPNSSSDLNEAGKTCHRSESSNMSLLFSQEPGEKRTDSKEVEARDLSAFKSRYRSLPARTQSSCLHDKQQKMAKLAAVSETEKIDQLLEEKKQERAWLQCRIDMQKRLSRIGPEFRSSVVFDGGHRTLPRQRSSPAPSRGRTSRLGNCSGATIRNSCVLTEEPSLTSKDASFSGQQQSDFSSSIDYLENLDVFPPPNERVFNPRCKTYPRKRSEFNSFNSGQNSPLLKEMMKQRVNANNAVVTSQQPNFAQHSTTMSLNDIAMRHGSKSPSKFFRPPTPLVLMSRTMSFTVRNDEIIDSIESSV